MGELDLKWGLQQYKASKRREDYELFRCYYDGEHRIAFATESFKSRFAQVFQGYSENFCEGVIDALADRLKITGFKSSLAETTVSNVAATPMDTAGGTPPRKQVVITDPQGDRAIEIWRNNSMDLKSSEVHVESLKEGDAYILVWPDEQMQPALWPQLAQECSVQYDPNTPGKIIRASKLWYDVLAGIWRLNVYLPEAILKYRFRKKNDLHPTFEQTQEWVQYEGGNVPNPYGVVPVFHFPNKLENKHGISELKNAISLQDGLNKSDIDMLVAMEFAAYKQRYIIGMDPEMDEETGQPVDPNVRNYGPDRMMSIPDAEAKVGQFDATDLAQFLRVQEKFWGSAARVTGTPLHYFFITSGDFPSGEAMKSAEARFVNRITDRQTSFGTQWEKVMLFAMQIGGITPADLQLDILWKDASPRTDSEIADTAVKKKAVGVSRSQILKELGYDDETIQRMLEESDALAVAQAALGAKATPEGTNPNGQPKPQAPGTQGVRR